MLVMSGAIDARRCASELGAGGFVSKPFDLDGFLNVVERLSLSNTGRRAPTSLGPLSEKPACRANPDGAARPDVVVLDLMLPVNPAIVVVDSFMTVARAATTALDGGVELQGFAIGSGSPFW
jgi:hypothetical protein